MGYIRHYHCLDPMLSCGTFLPDTTFTWIMIIILALGAKSKSCPTDPSIKNMDSYIQP